MCHAPVAAHCADRNPQHFGSLLQTQPAFHPQATIFGYLGPDLIAGPIQILYDWVDANEPATELQSWIASIDLQGTIASVRLEEYNWSGHRFTDLFTLLKVEGEWKIINKVFHLHPEGGDR